MGLLMIFSHSTDKIKNLLKYVQKDTALLSESMTPWTMSDYPGMTPGDRTHVSTLNGRTFKSVLVIVFHALNLS